MQCRSIHIADTLRVSGIPFLNYKPNRFAFKVAPFVKYVEQRGPVHCAKGATPTLGI